MRLHSAGFDQAKQPIDRNSDKTNILPIVSFEKSLPAIFDQLSIPHMRVPPLIPFAEELATTHTRIAPEQLLEEPEQSMLDRITHYQHAAITQHSIEFDKGVSGF